MGESIAVAKEADAKKSYSPTRSSSKSIHRVRDGSEMQLGSLGGVIGNIRSNGDKPSVESIATQLSDMPTGEHAPVLLALQQTHGNRYVQRVVSGIQAKLVVGQPGDIYEQEADRVADEVMRMPEPEVQGRVAEEEEESIQTKPLAEEITHLVQKQIGHDFSQMRVDTDSKAVETARSVNAKAFTTGRDVVFGAGQYVPDTLGGRQLMRQRASPTVHGDDWAIKINNAIEEDAGLSRIALKLLNGLSTQHMLATLEKLYDPNNWLFITARMYDPLDKLIRMIPSGLGEESDTRMLAAITAVKMQRARQSASPTDAEMLANEARELTDRMQQQNQREVIRQHIRTQPPSEYRTMDFIERWEDRKYVKYPDSKNNPTIGVGFNLNRGDAREKLEKVGADYDTVFNGGSLNYAQISALLHADVQNATNLAPNLVPRFYFLPERVQLIIIDMIFNLGEGNFREFRCLRAALAGGDFGWATHELQDSKWFKQVGKRSQHHVDVIRGLANMKSQEISQRRQESCLP